MMLVDGRRLGEVPAADRGLAYGDGLFETIAVVGGKPCLWDAHLARLAAGCRRLGIPPPDPQVLAVEAACVIGDAARAVLKLIYSRGDGGRGYEPPEPATPRRILSLYPVPEHPDARWRDGLDIGICTLRLAEQPALAGLKHLNRLEQVLARAECRRAGVAEGLLLDQNDRVVEAVAANVFAVRDGALLTPELTRAGVAGVMRARVLAIAVELGLPCEEAHVSLAELLRADEVFLTNSLIGIWPVRTVDGRGFAPGPVTRRLQARLQAESCSLMPASR